MGIEGLVDFERKMGLTGCSIAWGAVAAVGYAARHHLADHAMAVRFEHAWACMEAAFSSLKELKRSYKIGYIHIIMYAYIYIYV